MKYIIVAVVVIIFLLFKVKHLSDKANQLDRNLVTLAQDYKFKLQGKDKRIATQQQVIIDKNSRLAKLSDSLDYIKDQKSQVRVVTNTVFKKDTIEKVKVVTKDDASWLLLPYTFTDQSEWHYSEYTIYNSLVRDSLAFRNDFIVSIGKEDHGSWIKNVFKQNKPIVYFKDQNPYTSVQQMQNVIIDNQSRFSLGLSGGYALTSDGLGPYIGIGVNYSLIQF